MLKYCVLSLFLAGSWSWHLETTHSRVVPKLTRQVSLTCRLLDNRKASPQDIRFVYRARILKLDQGKTWKTYATDEKYSFAKDTGQNVIVSGKIGEPSHSFLKVKWTTAEAETAGSYKCEIDGFDSRGGMTIHYTKDVSITAVHVSPQNIVDLYVEIRSDSKKMHELLNENQKAIIDNHTILKAKLQEHKNKSNAHLKRFTEHLEDIRKDINDEVNVHLSGREYELTSWPKGPFALPAPEDGCPNDPSSFLYNSHIRMSFSGYTSYLEIPPSNHFMQPVLERGNYFYLRFCQQDSNTGYLSWPKGSYCLYAGQSQRCPPKFTSGYFNIAHGKSMNVAVKKGAAYSTTTERYGYRNSYTRTVLSTYYCCRNDGPPSSAIKLPTQEPFYLYRYSFIF